MKVLGIESSCDETAAAVVEDGFRLLSNVVGSQMDDFAKYGGVIPEVAARSHIEAVVPVIEKALSEAGCTWGDIDAIAVTYAPGLVGSLLVGTLAARTLALVKHKPLYPVHHVEGHVYANFLIAKMQDGKIARAQDRQRARSPEGKIARGQDREMARSQDRDPGVQGVSPSPPLPSKQPDFPMLALIVSGGHTQLALFYGHGDYVLLGQAQDDAVGEAFDKVAKIIGLPYPGGVAISKLAPSGDRQAFQFPRARLACPAGCKHAVNKPLVTEADKAAGIRGGRGEIFAKDRCHRYDFSFSGTKTAVLRAVQREVGKDHTFSSHKLPELVSDSLRANVAASFEQCAVETLVEKTVLAFEEFRPASVVIAGGVAANQELRRQLKDALPISIEYAPMSLCTDNAAMIASLGYFRAQQLAPTDPRDVEVLPSESMTRTAWGKKSAG